MTAASEETLDNAPEHSGTEATARGRSYPARAAALGARRADEARLR